MFAAKRPVSGSGSAVLMLLKVADKEPDAVLRALTVA